MAGPRPAGPTAKCIIVEYIAAHRADKEFRPVDVYRGISKAAPGLVKRSRVDDVIGELYYKGILEKPRPGVYRVKDRERLEQILQQCREQLHEPSGVFDEAGFPSDISMHAVIVALNELLSDAASELGIEIDERTKYKLVQLSTPYAWLLMYMLLSNALLLMQEKGLSPHEAIDIVFSEVFGEELMSRLREMQEIMDASYRLAPYTLRLRRHRS